MSGSEALFAAFPQLRASLPTRELGVFPTPLERIGELPGGAELWVKREDQASPGYGGNKVRKLELLLADPRVQPGSRLLTFGAWGSNHVLATAYFGRVVGCSVDAVVYPQPPGPWLRPCIEAQLGAGAHLWPCRSYFDVPLKLVAALRARPRPVLIAPGASSPLGNVGWVAGGIEIAAQARAAGVPRFDGVYCALGSGGMAAGLWLGLGEAAAELVAVRVVPWPVGSGPVVRWLAARTRALLVRRGMPGSELRPRSRLRIDGRFVGGGYGHPSLAAQAAVATGAELGLRLESTYTGKTFAALLADSAAGRLRGKRVLFVDSYSSVDLGGLRSQADLSRLPGWLQARIGR